MLIPFFRTSYYFILFSIIALPMACQNWAYDDSAPGSSKAGGTEKSTSGHILYLHKNGKPFILIDIAPSIKEYASLCSSAQEEFLLKKALVALFDNKSIRNDYDGHDLFIFRMVCLTEKDEYGRPKWGTASEVAMLMARGSGIHGITKDEVFSFNGERLRTFFSSIEIAPH